MNVNKLAQAAAAVFALSAGFAQAGVVDVWTVGVNSTFDPNSIVSTSGPVTPPGSAPNVVISNSDRRLRWGVDIGNGQSGMDITNSPTSANVATNGAAVANIQVTHHNNAINAPSLDRVNILSTLTLTPFTPPLPGMAPVTMTFGINFLETDNGATPCADGAANGVGVNINGCSDIFVIEASALNFAFTYDTGDGIDQQYFISFFEQSGGLNPLSAAACLATTGVNAPCLGFQTREGGDTTFNFASVITTERVVINVPEPGSLALAGVALAGLAGFGRRRKAVEA